MRIELETEKKNENDESSEFANLIASQGEDKKQKNKELFSQMGFKDKLIYIWDYYKWWIIGTVALVAVTVSMVTTIKENSKPVYLSIEMINTYLGNDSSNTVEEDFIKELGIDTEVYNTSFGFDMILSNDAADAGMMGFRERLIANYAAATLDVVIAPKKIIEGAANCDNYARLDEILPQDLIDELKDREYEFYYFDPLSDDIEDDEGDDLEPYFAGVYLDTCSYLNNMGENGAYPTAENDEDKVIFTITANGPCHEHAAEFLRFLIHNR